jgi:hypothetical protein
MAAFGLVLNKQVFFHIEAVGAPHKLILEEASQV